MKRKTLSAFLTPLIAVGLLTACEKSVMDDVDDNVTTTGNVTIRVSDVEAGWDGCETRTMVEVGEVCSRLCFAIYNKDGKREKSKNQTSEDKDFGTLSIDLEPGNYEVLVLAHSGKANPTTTNPQKVAFTNPESSGGTGFTDTFYYYGKIEATSDKTEIDISMKRATSMFRLVTSDTKPASIKKFQFYYEGGSGTLDATTGWGCVNSKQSVFVSLDDAQTGQPLEFNMYTFLHAETGLVSFTVKAFNANEDVVYSKVFNEVPMQRNCITRYTGNFFVTSNPDDTPDTPEDPASGKQATAKVMVDPDWAAILDYTF